MYILDLISVTPQQLSQKFLQKISQKKIHLPECQILDYIYYMIDVYAVTSLEQGAIDGPRMPVTLSGSCVVKYNDTSIYILGGIQNYTRKLKEYNHKNVWIASISDEITFSQGPSMLEERYSHACGTISFGNKNLIIVAGGITGGRNEVRSSSVEILDPSTNRWVKGMY